MTSAIVREATPEDIEATIDVYETVAAELKWVGGEPPVDRERQRAVRLERIQSGKDLVLVTTSGDAIVGELLLNVSGGRAELGMSILESHRGHGIGSSLMDYAISWARARQLDKIFLEVWPGNERAIALYEKFGFKREGYHPRQHRRASGEVWDTVSMGLLL